MQRYYFSSSILFASSLESRPILTFLYWAQALDGAVRRLKDERQVDSIFDLSWGLSFILSVISQTSTHSISSHHRFVFYAQLNTRPLCLRWIQYLSDKNISVKNERPVDIRNRPRIPVPDEDPYSVAGSGSSGSSAVRERSKDKPPKLPPRDSIYGPQNIPKVRGEGESVYFVCQVKVLSRPTK